MKNSKKTNKILNELRRQGCTIKEKQNNVLIIPPDEDAEAYTLHRNDKHVGALVDHCLKRFNHFLNFRKLAKLHKRFQNGAKK
jgi:hypothetical protein